MTTDDFESLIQHQPRWQIRTAFAHQDARQTSAPMSQSPNQRIAQAAFYYSRLRGIPESQRDIYRQHGIYTHEPWCVNFVSAVCAAAGLRPPGGAHVNNIPEIGSRVAPLDIQPGDIAMNSRHTGIVTNVRRDSTGRAISYELLNGNTVENGRWTVGLTRITLNNNPYQFYRHNGEPSRVAPPAIFVANMGVPGSVFCSDLRQRRTMTALNYTPTFSTPSAPPEALAQGGFQLRLS